MTWQPIETAPQTGQQVAAFCPVFPVHPVKLARWSKAQKAWIDDKGCKISGVTYWLPIPDYPEKLRARIRPKKGLKYPGRDLEISTRYNNGEGPTVIGRDYKISPARVWQIAKKMAELSGKSMAESGGERRRTRKWLG